MARELFLLSAGAAKAVVLSQKAAFETATQTEIHATFGAVGAMRECLAAGAPCDVLILSAKILDELARERAIESTTRTSLGHVGTGVAVCAGAAIPAIADADALRTTLAAASALFLPDPERSTAGIHCVDVLQRLQIFDAMRARMRPFANGAEAMAELARSADPQALGCTQVTEILYTDGVAFVGPLPPGFELNTEYAGAVTARARASVLALRFLEHLGGPATLAVRRAGGFEA